MEFEPWWLIALPILFALGWLAAKIDQKQVLADQQLMPASYFKGLSFLINEQSDRAIDAFIEVAQLNPETIELHFALGNLFRRRGEIERSIRVHQSLALREDIPQHQKEEAIYALAQDYQRAGMLDRAEDAYGRLANSRFQVAALKGLLGIYEAERNWNKSIELVRVLEQEYNELFSQTVHFYCEKVQLSLAAKPMQLAEAQDALTHAWQASCQYQQKKSGESVEVPHPRVLFLSIAVADETHGAHTVHAYFELVFTHYPDYSGLLAVTYLERMRAQGLLNAGIDRLSEVYQTHPNIDVLHAIFSEMYQENPQRAWQFAQSAFERKPSLLGLDMVLQVMQAFPTSVKHSSAHASGNHGELPAQVAASPSNMSNPSDLLDAVFVARLIQKHTQRFNRYVCHHCGFKAKKFHWQCPGCNQWDSYLPKRVEELDGHSV